MSARTAESIVKIKVTERGIQIVLVQHPDDPGAKPEALRIGRGTAEQARGFGKRVDFLLFLLAGIRGRRRLLALILGFLITPALLLRAQRRSNEKENRRAHQRYEGTQTRDAHDKPNETVAATGWGWSNFPSTGLGQHYGPAQPNPIHASMTESERFVQRPAAK